jgi:hypothetical protein
MLEISKMRCTSAPSEAQELSPEVALQIARERFPNLSSGGILPKLVAGMPVNLSDLADALAFLAQCRKTDRPTEMMHSFDLRRAVDVSVGALIAAATALKFEIHSWFGVTGYAPHAMIAVNAADVVRVCSLRNFSLARFGDWSTVTETRRA